MKSIFSFAARIYSMISLGLSIDEPEAASATAEDDDLPALEPASASAMEEVSFFVHSLVFSPSALLIVFVAIIGRLNRNGIACRLVSFWCRIKNCSESFFVPAFPLLPSYSLRVLESPFVSPAQMPTRSKKMQHQLALFTSD